MNKPKYTLAQQRAKKLVSALVDKYSVVTLHQYPFTDTPEAKAVDEEDLVKLVLEHIPLQEYFNSLEEKNSIIRNQQQIIANMQEQLTAIHAVFYLNGEQD